MSQDAPTRAALIGGCANALAILGGLLGVFLNLAWNRKQHQDEKSYNLRRDVYLASVEVVNRAVSFLCSRVVPSFNREKEEAAKTEKEILTEVAGACAKLHILGGQAVVAAAITFQNSFEAWWNKVSQYRRSHHEAKSRCDAFHEKIKECGERINAAIAQKDNAAKLVTDFARDKKEQEAIPEIVKDAINVIEGWKERFAALDQELSANGKIGKEAIAEVKKHLQTAFSYLVTIQKDLNPLLANLTLAMKDDLGLRTDAEWYKNEMAKALRDALQSQEHTSESAREKLQESSVQAASFEAPLNAAQGEEVKRIQPIAER